MSQVPQDHRRAARRKLEAARSLLSDGFPEEAAAEAYFSMLSAARAALAERGHFAKTHRGTWQLFAQFFVKPGLVTKSQYDAAQRAMELRNAADYWGGGASSAEAREALGDAESFLEEVREVAKPSDREGDDTGGGA